MSLKNALGGTLLIAGTAIGAAVLAFPIATAPLGFLTSIALFLICWLFMTLGALYVLEANLMNGYGVNLITMAHNTLGQKGQILMWVSYLFLLYALTAAYLTGAGAWLQEGLKCLQFTLSLKLSAFLVSLLVSAIVILGTHFVDLLNRMLMIVLFGVFFAIVFAGPSHITGSQLIAAPQLLDLSAIPIIITGFGFAIIVPTLTDYLHGKPNQLKHVIMWGSFGPLFLYIIWQAIILGIIPQSGENSLLIMRDENLGVIELSATLARLLKTGWITQFVQAFSVFALATSILGVTLSIFDFLADGLKLSKTLSHKWLLALITFVPPLIFVWCYPQGYIFALSFAGIFVSIILGIFPALMVWRGRYHLAQSAGFQVIGGKPLLLITTFFFLCVITLEIANNVGHPIQLSL